MIAPIDQAHTCSARWAVCSARASSGAPDGAISANWASGQENEQIEGRPQGDYDTHRQCSKHDGAARTMRNDLGDANILGIIGPDGVPQRPLSRAYVK
jgi:hypothetical protein